MLLIGILTLSVFAASNTVAPEPTEEQKMGPPIKIGAAVALTGGLFREGEGIKKGYELWAEQVNKQGGIDVGGEKRMVKMIFYDDQSTPATGAQLAEKLIIKDKVDFIFGPYGSSVTFAVAAVTERYGKVFINPSGNADTIYQQGYKKIFGLQPIASTVLTPVIDMVKILNAKLNKVASLHKEDIFATYVSEGAAKYAVEKYGWERVYLETFPVDNQDFSTLITKMKTANPDVIMYGGHSTDVSLVVSQMRDFGVNVKAFACAIALEDVIDAIGDDANYLYTNQFWSKEVRWQGDDIFGNAENFNKLYREKYGEDAYSVPAQAAAAGVIFQKAVEGAGSLDQDALEQALRKLDTTIFFGPVRYNELGINVAAQTGILQVQDGEVKLVWPPEAAPVGNSPIFPMPTWEER